MTDANEQAPSGAATPLHRYIIAPYSLLGAVPFSMVLFMPMFVGGFVTDFGLTDRQAGTLAACNIAGFGIASLLAFLWVAQWSVRGTVLVAMIAFIVANAVSGFVHGYASLLGVRFIEGLAAGTVSSGVVVSIGRLANVDRQYGIWLTIQLLYGTLGFLAIPSIFSAFGSTGGFTTIALLGALCLPLAFTLPCRLSALPVVTKAASAGSGHPAWGVVAILAFYIGLNIVWAFLERIGARAGLDLQSISWALSIANLAGLAGAVIVAIGGNRLNRLAALITGLPVTALAVLALLGKPSLIIFAVSTSVYLFGWCFVIPLMLGAIGDIDIRGRYVALGNAAIGIGLAVGPYVGALLTGQGYGYDANLYAGCGLMLASVVLILPIVATRSPLSGAEKTR
ncbi:putative MFS family arabinose efflux permease [Novosphingobium sp. SG751A]|uniref:MFS transporter n=1 Tax=Novosphingobium sp. SG751A TaxID=2587000 RepID=UPI001552D935|nr:MFS transporter [Novosphingobium sp. SG751A]NOW44930.1 putative MFS family arabinose efflux permease [Novosphingobium sp. SG751A]